MVEDDQDREKYGAILYLDGNVSLLIFSKFLARRSSRSEASILDSERVQASLQNSLLRLLQ